MSDDLVAASHIFGYVASTQNYFQLFGAFAIFLVLYLSVRRWWPDA